MADIDKALEDMLSDEVLAHVAADSPKGVTNVARPTTS